MALSNTKNTRTVITAISMVVAIVLLATFTKCQTPREKYFTNEGNVFGTTYHIKYQADADLQEAIVSALQEVDNSLSVFNPQSTLSAINEGSTQTDAHFRTVYNKAAEIYQLSEGALDITVSPLIDAWGFGKSDKPKINAQNQQVIDSILTFVGFSKTHLNGEQFVKDDPRITLNMSAIAKGYGCDIVAALLDSKGIANYMVEIGGEIVSKGVNKDGNKWRVGINTPEDDPQGINHETQEIIEGNLALATSGSYRQFYDDENGIRRSHTIDPRTGAPVTNNLLSVSIIANDCMTADGLATACMVMGLDASLEMIEKIEGAECFLIYDIEGEHLVKQSSGFGKYLVNK